MLQSCAYQFGQPLCQDSEKKTSIVQKKVIPHMNGLLVFFKMKQKKEKKRKKKLKVALHLVHSNSFLQKNVCSVMHGLLYKWTELLHLTCPHEADLLTLIVSQNLTQYL